MPALVHILKHVSPGWTTYNLEQPAINAVCGALVGAAVGA